MTNRTWKAVFLIGLLLAAIVGLFRPWEARNPQKPLLPADGLIRLGLDLQ